MHNNLSYFIRVYKEPLLNNKKTDIDQTYNATIKYLESNQELYNRICLYLLSYNWIGQLFPSFELRKAFSGSHLPHQMSYNELENSYHLCLQGFYIISFATLRNVLELGLYNIFLAFDDNEHINIQEWLASLDNTPSFRGQKCKTIINTLKKLDYFEVFDEKFNYSARINQTYSILNDYTHRKGLFFSQSKYKVSDLIESGCPLYGIQTQNQFYDSGLKEYTELMFEVVSLVSIAILLKYPIGLQELPLFEKYGWNGFMSGFLDDYQEEILGTVITEEERAFLTELSNNDNTVIKIIEGINAKPDLNPEEIKQQEEEWDKQYGKNEAEIY